MTATVAGSVKPADFDAYWNAIDDELARFPIAAEARHTPLHDTEFSTSYDVELDRHWTLSPFWVSLDS